MTLPKLKKGFTLIELLVVIIIIGILAALGAASYSNAQAKSRDSKRKADLQAIRQALELYFQTNDVYPPTVTTGGYPCGRVDQTSNPTFFNAMTSYINPMPQDPSRKNQAGDYVYYLNSSTAYTVGALLENTDDSEVAGPYAVLGTCGGTTPYNYRFLQP